MKTIWFLVCLASLTSASLSDMASLLNYRDFVKDFAKEALVSFAENLAEKGSNDFCQDFATYLVNAVVDKYSAMENTVKIALKHFNRKFFKQVITYKIIINEITISKRKNVTFQLKGIPLVNI
jgi:hypothetical protein